MLKHTVHLNTTRMSCLPGSKAGRKRRLNAVFDDIVNNVSIDYTNQEIQDIQGAVLELLERAKEMMNKRGIFNISRIEPCGSMAEKMAIWKKCHPTPVLSQENSKELLNYLEFDFLAVVEGCKDFHIESTCPSCMKVIPLPLDHEVIQRCYGTKYVRQDLVEEDTVYPVITDTLFKSELYYSIASSCNCLSVVEDIFPDVSILFPRKYSFVKKAFQTHSECGKCSIGKESGFLQIATSVQNEFCSLILIWTSIDGTLFAPDEISLQKSHQIKYLPIYIDFLPAIEISKPNGNVTAIGNVDFLVPKRCVSCDSSSAWRASFCKTEIDMFVNRMSGKHKKCYAVLKFFLDYKYRTPYHVKTALLNHCMTCLCSSTDCLHCVTDIFRKLRKAYKRHELKAFGRQTNLLPDRDYCFRLSRVYELRINQILKVLSKCSEWKTLRHDLNFEGVWERHFPISKMY